MFSLGMNSKLSYSACDQLPAQQPVSVHFFCKDALGFVVKGTT
jgi:hypothetical protein